MNFSNSQPLWAIALSIGILLASCKKDENQGTALEPPIFDSYTLIGESSVNDATVKLYATETPFVGYNNVVVQVLKSGTNEAIKDAEISLLPMMDMGAMMHSAPFSTPVYDAMSESYNGAVTFIMPSGMGSWNMGVIIDNTGQKDTLNFPVVVESKTDAKLFSFESKVDQAMVFIALRQPNKPEIGLNSFEVMSYYRKNMMSFPPLDSLQIFIEPEMPSMGHGSPNNKHPEFMGNGHYQGQVNFTMSGFWRVHLTVLNSNGDTLNSESHFDLNF